MSALLWILWASVFAGPAAPASESSEGGEAVASPAPEAGSAPAPAADSAASEAASTPWYQNLDLTTAIVVIVVIVVLAAIVYAIWRWRSKRKNENAVEDSGPSTASQLRKTWIPFYRALPAHAEHFSTFVVMGDAGVGKSTLIDYRVDWRGQVSQYMPSVDHDAPVQLYLGPDLIAHELSAGVLRDESQGTKRALRQMWHEMGSSATVVLVLDATTLLTMDRAERRELAQLARGKISLFPSRARDKLDVRLYLSKLDRVEGYLEFAATLGSDHPAIGVSSEGQAIDAHELLRAFDEHLAHALINNSGREFDGVVSFYDTMPALVEALTPIIEVFSASDEMFGARYPASGLYLGSLVPHSHVGNPFVVDRDQIEVSISERERRHRSGSLALGAVLILAVSAMTYRHGKAVYDADEAVEAFVAIQDGELDANELERGALEQVEAALKRMDETEILWMSQAFVKQKEQVAIHFEQAIYEHYLEPRFEATSSRVSFIYLLSMIKAKEGTTLAQLILDNHGLWAQDLDLPTWLIDSYINSSIHIRDDLPDLPEELDDPGALWFAYLETFDRFMDLEYLSAEDVGRIKSELPKLLGEKEYEVLARAVDLLLSDPETHLSSDVQLTLEEPLNSWRDEQYTQLVALSNTVEALDVLSRNTSTWGLSRLCTELSLVSPPSGGRSFRVELESAGELPVVVSSEELDAVAVRSNRHDLIDAVLARLARERPVGGQEFFEHGTRLPDEGVVSGYGGGPSERIDGHYTRAAFEAELAPTFDFANLQLEGSDASAQTDAGTEEAASEEQAADEEQVLILDLAASDRRRLSDAIHNAGDAYASAYKQELISYYESFNFDPGAEIALPYAIKPFAQSSSWFVDFLLAWSRNATIEFPAEDLGGYYDAQRDALESFAPLATLLAEDAGQVAGLEPYQAVIAALQLEVEEAINDVGDPDAIELIGRLSTLGEFALGVKTGINPDYAEQISDWLFGAGVGTEWYGPFLAPVRQVERYGRRDVEAKVATAWMYDVRPIVLPLLEDYPFEPSSRNDATVADIERIARMQGEVPGEFWDAFDRFVRPAMREGEIRMLSGIGAPGGMLAMARDLERMSSTLWDEAGERVPLEVLVNFELLPMEAFEERYPSIASLASGGGSVFGFNQRSTAQTLRYEWWNQDVSMVSVTYKRPGATSEDDDAARSYRLTSEGSFSLMRLFDRAERLSIGTEGDTITEIAMSRGTRCDRRGPQRTRNITLGWSVPLGRYGASSVEVSAVIESDAWEPFAIRSCR